MKTHRDIRYSIEHTIKRCQERYQLSLSEKDYFGLCESVKPKPDQEVYEITYKNVKMNVVWCHKRKCITTVLK